MAGEVHTVSSEDAARLQRVLDGASDGDVVELGPGTYPGPLAIRASVLLLGVDGAERTVIDGGGRGRALVVEGDDLHVSLGGLTLTGGASGMGAGLAVMGQSDLDASRCVFRGNAAFEVGGGALYASAGRVDLSDCVFVDNRGASGGALLLDDVALCSAVNCVFVGGRAERGGAVRMKGGAMLSCLHCTVVDCGAAFDLSGEALGRPRLRLSNCVVSEGEGALRVDASLVGAVVVSGSALPRDWEGATRVEGDVRFQEIAMAGDRVMPRLPADAPALGIADWTLSLSGDALMDLEGRPRLEDGRIDPGALEALDSDR